MSSSSVVIVEKLYGREGVTVKSSVVGWGCLRWCVIQGTKLQ